MRNFTHLLCAAAIGAVATWLVLGLIGSVRDYVEKQCPSPPRVITNTKPMT